MTIPYSNSSSPAQVDSTDAAEGQTLCYDTTSNVFKSNDVLNVNKSVSRVGINTASPSSTLHVNGNIQSSKIVLGSTQRLSGSSSQSKFFMGNTAYGTNMEIQLSAYSNGTAYYRDGSVGTNAISFCPKQLGESNNTPVGTITIGTTSTSYNTSSDYRLKENIIQIENSIEKLKILQPKTFNFISDPQIKVDGFIAHELSEAVPSAVSGEKDEVNPHDNEPVYQGVDASKLIPILVGALQEAISRIEVLEQMEKIKF